MVKKEGLMLFSGTSHEGLAHQIAKYLNLSLSGIKISRFAGGEIYTRILDNVRGQHTVIFQTCTHKVNEELMELFVIMDALKRASAASVTVVLPHFGYARQDRKAASREPISARLICDLISTAGADRIIAMDLHSDQIQGFVNIPMDHLTALPLFTDYIKAKKLKDIVVVAPDTGRAKAAKKFSDRLGADLAILHKARPGHHKSEILHVIGNVKNKTAIVTDDMIDTAGTMAAGIETLKKKGCNPDIYVVATHAILSPPAASRLAKAKIKEVVVTDTLPIPKEKQFKGLKVLSSAELLGEAIKRNYENRSISSLFD
jgi:ribose-phosphate pyrophosphokinase